MSPKAEFTSGSGSAATAHTEEPQFMYSLLPDESKQLIASFLVVRGHLRLVIEPASFASVLPLVNFSTSSREAHRLAQRFLPPPAERVVAQLLVLKSRAAKALRLGYLAERIFGTPEIFWVLQAQLQESAGQLAAAGTSTAHLSPRSQ